MSVLKSKAEKLQFCKSRIKDRREIRHQVELGDVVKDLKLEIVVILTERLGG